MKTKRIAIITEAMPVVAWTMRRGSTEAVPVVGETNQDRGGDYVFNEYRMEVDDEPGNIRDYLVVPAAPGWFVVSASIAEMDGDGLTHRLGEHLDKDAGDFDGWVLAGNQHVVAQAASGADALKSEAAQNLVSYITEALRGRYRDAAVTSGTLRDFDGAAR